jgi:formylglycine-generating enzyme required for sulfatase activity
LTGYVKKRVGEEKFARVLRHLVHEEISIRDLRHIIAGLATMAPPSNAPLGSQLIVFVNTYSAAPADSVPSGRLADRAATEVAEMARVSLKRYISHKYTRGQNTLIVYLLESELEQRLARRQPLSNAERRWLIESVRTEVGSLPPTAHNPCLLTTTDIRWRLRCELGGSFPNLAVLCYQELSPEMNIQPIARIKLDDPPPTGPLDRVDEAIHELRFQEAEEALEDLVASRPPWAVVEPRLTELLYFWNEAGDAERVVRNLSIWPELRGEPAETWEIANHRDQAAVRRWLTTRDRWRRLRAQYMPAAEDFVQVKGGSFSMGEPGATQGDRPAHTVGVDDFAVASLPVTGRQFALFLAANQKPIPRDWVRADEAARGIGWREAIEYCRWLTRVSGLENVYTVPASSADGSASAGMAVEAHHQRNGFRLPTEAEWEYAARGGAASRGLRFAGSDSLADAGDVLGLDPAGLRRANELGLYEMSGGRAEWCWDWYGADFYNQSPIRNPMGPAEGASRVCRGGDVTGLGNVDACTVHAREGAARRLAAYRSMNLGFRLFRSALDR